MKDKRIAVFPIDEDFLSLPNNQYIQLERECHQISYYITLAGWNIKNAEIQLHTLEKFNFENIDTLVLINSFRKLEDEVIKKNFHLCGWKIEQCNQLKIKILYTI